MKLVNTQTKAPLVEFVDGKAVFHNKYLEKEMQTIGILVPHGLRGVFQGKDLIHLGDEEFERAFKEIYYLTYVDHKQFVWEK